MEFILLLIIFLLFFTFVICYDEFDKKIKKLRKENRRIRFEINKLKDNEYYIFDYLTGIYEDLERGTYEKSEDL